MHKSGFTIKAVLILLLLAAMLLAVSGAVHATTYIYDDLGRLTEVIYDDGQRVLYEYDAAGNITSVEVIPSLQLEPIGDRYAVVGQKLEFTVQASGEGEFNYSADNLPEGAVFDASTRTFSWTPAEDQVGEHTGIYFQVESKDAKATEEITITVSQENTPAGEGIIIKDEESGAELVFEEVESTGTTTIDVTHDLTEEEYQEANLLPGYYQITTTAEASGKVEIILDYDARGYVGEEEALRLYHLKDGRAEDITHPLEPGPGGNPDTEAGTIRGVTQSFSGFAVGAPSKINLSLEGDPVRLNAYLPPEKEVHWESSNEEIVTVSPEAKLTPHSLGQAVVTGKTEDGSYSLEYQVTVTTPVLEWATPLEEKVSIPGTFLVEFHLYDENRAPLCSSNLEVHLVEETGETTSVYPVSGTPEEEGCLYRKEIDTQEAGLQPGRGYTVKVNMDGYALAESGFSTKKQVQLTITPEVLDLQKGEQKQLQVDLIQPESGYTLEYNSTDEQTVTVDKSGKVTAEAEGAAEIIITADAEGYNSTSETLPVTITEKDTESPDPSPRDPTPSPDPEPEPELEEPEDPSITPLDTTRLHGPDRYRTAVEISREAYPEEGSAEAVVLARGDDFPDALAGVPLAHDRNAPLLLTRPDMLPGATAAEISRILPEDKTVYVLGGAAAVNPEVVEHLRQNHTVKRLAGENRYETATTIAEALTENPQETFLTTGRDFPDAVAASGAAATRGAPVLLTAPDNFPESTAGYFSSYKDKLSEVYIIGGTAAVGQQIYRKAGGTHRIAGTNRWETAVETAEHFHEVPENITLATGRDYPDALTGGAYAASMEAPLLLTSTGKLPPEVKDYLHDLELPPENLCTFGGTGAVAEEIVDQVEIILGNKE